MQGTYPEPSSPTPLLRIATQRARPWRSAFVQFRFILEILLVSSLASDGHPLLTLDELSNHAGLARILEGTHKSGRMSRNTYNLDSRVLLKCLLTLNAAGNTGAHLPRMLQTPFQHLTKLLCGALESCRLLHIQDADLHAALLALLAAEVVESGGDSGSSGSGSGGGGKKRDPLSAAAAPSSGLELLAPSSLDFLLPGGGGTTIKYSGGWGGGGGGGGGKIPPFSAPPSLTHFTAPPIPQRQPPPPPTSSSSSRCWVCKHCTYGQNSAGSAFCEMCNLGQHEGGRGEEGGRGRAGGEEEVVVVGGGGGSGASGGGGSKTPLTWECLYCSFINPTSVPQCSMCEIGGLGQDVAFL